MPIKVVIITIFLLSFIFTFTNCTKEKFPNERTLNNLYKFYKNGEIDVCKYNGKTVYCAGINAYDAGSKLYDITGKPIGNCNYAWGQVDKICEQLDSCEVIYRCEDHISGMPAVDKYGLEN